jgi:hypothetical protein
MAGRGQPDRIGLARAERRDALVPFLRKYRTGAEQQAPAGGQQRPERVQQAILLRRQISQVGSAPQPAHVGVAAHDARSAARRIQQDGVVRRAVPPIGRSARVGHADVGGEPQPIQVLADAAAALGAHVQRRDARRGAELQQVCGLAAGRSAGVQHARRGNVQPIQQQRRGALRRGGLDRNIAFGMPRQCLYRQRLRQPYRAGAERPRPNALARQPLAIRRGRQPARVHAHIHRRGRLVGVQDRLPPVGISALQLSHPPGRMVPARHRFVLDSLQQCGAFAQKAAQAGVDETRLPPQRRRALGGFHRLVDQREFGVGRRARTRGQRQRGLQQRGHCRGGRATRQPRRQCRRGPQLAQHVERQRLRARALGVRDALQQRRGRATLGDALHHTRSGLQQAPQGGGMGGCRRVRGARNHAKLLATADLSESVKRPCRARAAHVGAAPLARPGASTAII